MLNEKRLEHALAVHAAKLEDIREEMVLGADLRDVCDKLFITFTRTMNIISAFDTQEATAPTIIGRLPKRDT
jgi:hypothetical protein